jgi:hypothetical protein
MPDAVYGDVHIQFGDVLDASYRDGVFRVLNVIQEGLELCVYRVSFCAVIDVLEITMPCLELVDASPSHIAMLNWEYTRVFFAG